MVRLASSGDAMSFTLIATATSVSARRTSSATNSPTRRFVTASTNAGNVGGVRPGSQEDLAQRVGDRIFFDSDRSDLRTDARRTVEGWAGWLRQNPTVAATIEGHADERGHGAGEGFNLNLPLPRGSGFEAWSAALEVALAAIDRFGAEALVVSLGLDTFVGDPISGFCLQSDDYLRLGERLARVGLPTVLVLEGGYAVDGLGVNAVNVLQAFA
jgi:hypothetical protein